MNKYVVRFTRIPTNFNEAKALVVEANSPEDAKAIVRDHVRDLGAKHGMSDYVWEISDYVPPPVGKILGVTK